MTWDFGSMVSSKWPPDPSRLLQQTIDTERQTIDTDQQTIDTDRPILVASYNKPSILTARP